MHNKLQKPGVNLRVQKNIAVITLTSKRVNG